MSLLETTKHFPDRESWDEDATERDVLAQHHALKTHYFANHGWRPAYGEPTETRRISSEEHYTLADYTSHSFTLNHHLITGKVERGGDHYDDDYPENDDLAEHLGHVHRTLQSTMAKMPAAPNVIHAYSCVGKLHAADLEKTPVGSVHEAKAWISSSIHPQQAEGFNRANHMIHFKIPRGSKVGAYLEGFSNCEGEHEFLISHGTKWKKTGESMSGAMKIHHLEPAE